MILGLDISTSKIGYCILDRDWETLQFFTRFTY